MILSSFAQSQVKYTQCLHSFANIFSGIRIPSSIGLRGYFSAWDSRTEMEAVSTMSCRGDRRCSMLLVMSGHAFGNVFIGIRAVTSGKADLLWSSFTLGCEIEAQILLFGVVFIGKKVFHQLLILLFSDRTVNFTRMLSCSKKIPNFYAIVSILFKSAGKIKSSGTAGAFMWADIKC